MKNKLFVLILSVALVLSLSCGVSASYSDVPAGSWYEESVNYVSSNGYMVGISGTEFGPSVTMDRAMLVTVLYRASGDPAPSENAGFSDVPSGKWYTDAVNWGVKEGIVYGFTDNTFRPLQGVTRQEMVAFLYRFMTIKEGCSFPSGNAIYNAFPDTSSVGNWAKESVRACISVGLISGADGNILPLGMSSRAQVASVLMRMDNYLAGNMGTVSVSCGSNGSVAPSGTYSLVKGSSLCVHMYPNASCRLDKVTVNGSAVSSAGSYCNIAVKNSPQSVYVTFKKLAGDYSSGMAVLINRSYPIANASSYHPSDLVSVGNGQQLRSEAASALNSMISAFHSAYPSYTLYAQSGYRTNSTQVYLYDRQIGRQGGNKYKAGTISAIPGTSEHELGLAVDLTRDGTLYQSFGSTVQGKWLAAHSYEYGYILRYPADKEKITGIIYEPWHFRYVGKAVAKEMKEMGVNTLEEYYGRYLSDSQITPYLPYLN